MKNKPIFVILIFLISWILSGCQPETDIEFIPVTIEYNSQVIQTKAQIGSSVQTILAENNISLSQFDKVTPSIFSHITQETTITITQVNESFETQELVIPFERQTVRNESLPDKQTILIQPGINGLREITYRLVYENGEMTSKTEISQVDIIEAKPEIIMIGVQNPFSPISISGTITYISSGNAWVMDGDTANRKPIVTNGLLDGRVLELSPDQEWLLYTQLSEDPEIINELYIINIQEEAPTPIYLKADNVIHYAEWSPGLNLAVLYSTVEPRSTAPGWQANNDLMLTTLGAGGRVIKTETVIDSNSGGIYGWWGSTFAYSPNGHYLAYARPDSIGLVDINENELIPLIEIIPFQTRSEWAWISPISWSPDSKFLYFVRHDGSGNQTNPESSMIFNLETLQIEEETLLNGVDNVGMFAYPSASPYLANNQYQLLYLNAIFPENSDTSRYRLIASDRDGSNAIQVFPGIDSPGIDPQMVEWSPCEQEEVSNCSLGLIYQGNIWIINNQDFYASQVTGDGLITKIDWK